MNAIQFSGVQVHVDDFLLVESASGKFHVGRVEKVAFGKSNVPYFVLRLTHPEEGYRTFNANTVGKIQPVYAGTKEDPRS